MATTTATRSTLDIKFHVDNNTVMGTNYTWKFNFPVGGTSSALTLADVKNALGDDPNAGANDPGFLNQNGDFARNGYYIYTKDGYKIDGVDGATIVTTVTTKNELS